MGLAISRLGWPAFHHVFLHSKFMMAGLHCCSMASRHINQGARMQSSYRVNLMQRAFHPASQTSHANQTTQPPIRQVLAHLRNLFPMTRHPARLDPEQPEQARHSKQTAPGAAVPASVLAGVAMQDWDTLFTAVKTRLTMIAQPTDAPGQPQLPIDAAQVERLRATILECVAALDQLHNMARDELTKGERLSR
jgi:hypothetical protein